jgi:bifunctional non-homologous end joining protein LigD
MTRIHLNAEGGNVKNKAPIAAGGKQGTEVATVAGIAITHPTKLWFPEEGITKLEVAQHHAVVAPRMLPWLNKRLLTAERCPDGITAGCFFEKNFAKELPAGIPTCAVPAGSAGKTVHYVVGGAEETLLTLVNLGCVAIHIMNCEVGSLDRPDWLAFDLDPSSGQFCHAAKAASVLRKLLEELRLRSFPKTTGGRGLHVLVPLRRGPNQEQVRLVARSISQELARRSPTLITVQMRKAKRQDCVFSDWLRNAFGQTIAAPYSVRCRPGAPVSTPLHWDEVSPKLNPSHFNIRTIQRRLEGKDPWVDFWRSRQTLSQCSNAFADAKSSASKQ